MGRLKTKRGVMAQRHDRKIKAVISVGRTQGQPRSSAAFTACAKIGTSGYNQRPGAVQPFPYACANGKNPRAAVSNALRYLAEKVKSRHGAFKGYSKRRRK